MRYPVVDLSECVDCDGCLEVCPEVFRRSDAGYIEVADLEDYPQACVDEAIMMCPAHCIFWEETETAP
jgi:ferredoxin